jgi:hypothetical protein
LKTIGFVLAVTFPSHLSAPLLFDFCPCQYFHKHLHYTVKGALKSCFYWFIVYFCVIKLRKVVSLWQFFRYSGVVCGAQTKAKTTQQGKSFCRRY